MEKEVSWLPLNTIPDIPPEQSKDIIIRQRTAETQPR
jgi:hypothetical protein